MQRVLSRAQVRDFDRRASELCHVPGLILMENAGRGAVDEIEQLFGGKLPERLPVVVVCGSGNNGGDGYVVARRLALLGADVSVLAIASEAQMRGDALVNRRAFQGIGGRVRAFSSADDPATVSSLQGAQVVVDALFGTGLDRELSPPVARLVEALNALPARKVALDVPSGLDADTGAVHGVAIRADVTVTFAAHKLGLLTPVGLAHSGRVVVKDIGVPSAAVGGVGESAFFVEAADVAEALPARARNLHKVSGGRVLVLGGSHGKTGAPLLTARGALRAGAGLVTIATWPDALPALASGVLEAMTAPLDPDRLEATLDPLLERTDVVAIGPGFGLDAAAGRVVERVLLRHSGTVIADADALTQFAGRVAELARSKATLVLTPHPGEMARLLGSAVRDVEADRFRALTRAVEESRACVLLKGPHTLIGAPGEPLLVGPAGTPALATGGSGDVLTGIIAGLACSVSPFVAAWTGVFVHAIAALAWAEGHGERGLLSSELADGVPAVLAELAADPRSLTD